MKSLIAIFGVAAISYAGLSLNNGRNLVPGFLLKQGMKLIYSSNGKTQPSWQITLLEKNISIGDFSSCSKIGIKYGAGEPVVVRTECLSGEYLFVDYGQGFSKSRPVGENLRLEKKNSSGHLTAVYETGSLSIVKFDELEIQVIETIVTNFNPDGSVKGRLLEKYSVDLGTAMEGVFEIPDSSHSGMWVAVNSFELTQLN